MVDYGSWVIYNSSRCMVGGWNMVPGYIFHGWNLVPGWYMTAAGRLLTDGIWFLGGIRFIEVYG